MGKLNISKVYNILSKNIYDMSLDDLQRNRVLLLDAWNLLNRHEDYCLTIHALEGGFIIPLKSESAKGYVPKDCFLSNNIQNKYDEIEKRLISLYHS